ncbi:MAG: hypothetical protein JST92_14975 [Deltaproteobacteria bacterium]|nr:hypothetical protein [Deltaproteobacteria bacterium]
MTALAEVIPGALLLMTGVGLIGASLGLFAEHVWDEWRASQRFRDVDRLVRMNGLASGRQKPLRRKRGRPWEAAEDWSSVSRPRPRS